MTGNDSSIGAFIFTLACIGVACGLAWLVQAALHFHLAGRDRLRAYRQRQENAR